MDKKTLNEITEKYDNTSPDQLRADLAVLTAINKRSGEILKISKPHGNTTTMVETRKPSTSQASKPEKSASAKAATAHTR